MTYLNLWFLNLVWFGRESKVCTNLFVDDVKNAYRIEEDEDYAVIKVNLPVFPRTAYVVVVLVVLV